MIIARSPCQAPLLYCLIAGTGGLHAIVDQAPGLRTLSPGSEFGKKAQDPAAALTASVGIGSRGQRIGHTVRNMARSHMTARQFTMPTLIIKEDVSTIGLEKLCLWQTTQKQ